MKIELRSAMAAILVLAANSNAGAVVIAAEAAEAAGVRPVAPRLDATMSRAGMLSTTALTPVGSLRVAISPVPTFAPAVVEKLALPIAAPAMGAPSSVAQSILAATAGAGAAQSASADLVEAPRRARVDLERLAATPRTAAFDGEQALPTVAVLYASIGGGHKAAGEALVARAAQAGIKARFEMIDVVGDEFLPEILRGGRINKGYQLAIQTSATAYDAVFRATHAARAAGLLGPLGQLGAASIPAHAPARLPRMLQRLRELRPVAIFSTFSHATEDVAAARALGWLDSGVRIASALTDYVDLPGYYRLIARHTDAIFLPSSRMLERFRARGFELKNATPSGIPVNPEFATRPTEAERRATAASLGLDPDVPTVFVISGRAGHARFERIVAGFFRKADRPLQVVIVAGENEQALRNLKKMAAANPNPAVRLIVHPTIPSSEVRRYMMVSSVVVSKAGGLTATEVATVGVPAVFIDNNGGQEVDNIRFFEEEGAALSSRDQGRIAEKALALIGDPRQSTAMREAQRRLMAGNDTDAPVEWLRRAVDDASGK